MCCIIVASDVCCPILVSAHRSVIQIFDTGVCDGIDLKTELANSPHVTQSLFNRHTDGIMILAVISNRNLAGCKDKLNVYLYDKCSAHCFDDMSGKLDS
jgi:hypothetical protein